MAFIRCPHIGKVMGMGASADGLLLCTISDDKSLKVFDVINFGEYFNVVFLLAYVMH